MDFLIAMGFQSEADNGISLRSNTWSDEGQNRGNLCLGATGLFDMWAGSIF